jgi:GntR family transcriptional regulator
VNHPLHLQVKEILWDEITRGEYANLDMLPPENELCSRFGVSRITLRHAVTSLEQQGYLRRRQGVGTIIDRNVCSMKTRIDLKIEYSELIRRAGFNPEIKLLSYHEEIADGEKARILKVETGDKLLIIKKLWLADGTPAILNTDIVTLSLLSEPYTPELLEKDIFTLFRKLTSCDLIYQIAEMVPRCIDNQLSQFFHLALNTPVICFSGVGYNIDGKPILLSEEVYTPGIVKFSMLRAKI